MQRECGESDIEICSGTLHKMTGDHKGKNARMASCCRAMYKSMNPGDEVVQLPKPRPVIQRQKDLVLD
ncbi:hypothetical protein KHA80_12275 [Anaerobacillus sp. HL2]|nr:hypothetical protein KHA80_12275 [Anaerobacillus sp. HL2]